MGLTRLVIQRPILLLMVLGAILILGWRAQMEMPAELDPRVDIPVVNIMTVYPGAGPEEGMQDAMPEVDPFAEEPGGEGAAPGGETGAGEAGP